MCDIPGCLNPEHWDGKYETQKHMVEYHTEEHEDYTGPADWAQFYPEGSFEAAFADLYQEAFELLVERQRKYGKHNIEQQGMLGVYTRMADDKMQRIGRSLNGRVVKGRIILDDVDPGTEAGDTLEDALLDVPNYSLIMLALHRGLWGRPLVEEMDD